jgi:hypothetical protein
MKAPCESFNRPLRIDFALENPFASKMTKRLQAALRQPQIGYSG